MMKILHGIRIIVFMLVLFLGMIISICTPSKEKSDMENRDLSQLLQFTLRNYFDGTFQDSYNNYLNDQFVFRDKWVTLASQIQYSEGLKEINGVYMGKDGYLLEKSPEKYDASQLKENIRILTKFINDMWEKYGEKHVTCMMIPSKAECLTKKLPNYVSLETKDNILKKIKNKLDNPDLLVDLNECLGSHQDEYIFYRTDHHWTTLGAYYAYNLYCEKNGFETRELSYYDRQTAFDDFYGTTYNKAHVPVKKDAVELFRTKNDNNITVTFDEENVYDSMYFTDAAENGFDRYEVFFSKNTFLVDIKHNKPDENKGTLLLIKDSFSNCFAPFLLDNYNRIIMVDYRYGKESIGSIIEKNDDISDVLVLYNTDKFVENTKLAKLGDTFSGASGEENESEDTLQEFDASDLFGDDFTE